MDKPDLRANEQALWRDEPVRSRFFVRGQRVWVISERSEKVGRFATA
jgi:hypothetical protein